jgi:hypothetical protein
VAERAPTTINGDGTNFEEVLHVPTALFGSTFANANGNRHSLAVRDNHMRAQLIDFGYERPSFKRVKVDEIFTPIKNAAVYNADTPLQKRQTRGRLFLTPETIATSRCSTGTSHESDDDSDYNPDDMMEVDILADDANKDEDGDWFFDPLLSNKGQENIARRNSNLHKMVSIQQGQFLTDIRRFPIAFAGEHDSVPHEAMVLVTAEAVTSLTHDRTNAGCFWVMNMMRNLESGDKRAPKVSRKAKLEAKQKNNQRQTRRSYSSSSSTMSAEHDASKGRATVPIEELATIHSWGCRTLILEDLFNLEINRSVSVFFKKEGLPPYAYKKALKCLESTNQQSVLPAVVFDGDKHYLQMHGRVILNVETKHWLSEVSLQSLTEMLQYSERSKHCVVLRCPGYGEGVDYDLKISFNEIFLFPRSIFLQAALPFKYNIAKLFRNLQANPRSQKALFHRLLQEFNVDRWLVQLLVTAWKSVVEKSMAILDTKHKCELDLDIANATGYRNGIQDSLHQPLLLQPGVTSFCERLDKLCEIRMQQTFGRFCNPNDNFLGCYEMRQIVSYLKFRLPLI